MPEDTQKQISNSGNDSFQGLKAMLFNATLKHPSQPSHTDTLLDAVDKIFRNQGVEVNRVRLTEYNLPPGVYPDMTEHGWPTDDWPALADKVFASDIIVLGTPIWLGQASSVAQNFIEKLYAHSGQVNDAGQYRFYGKVGGCLVTGNEDGVKHVGMSVLYSMQHVGLTIPPQADSGWLGEIGPGPSYGDKQEDGAGRVGFDNAFTQRNTTFMAFNLMHMAKMLKEAGGIPAVGNVLTEWDDGGKPGWPYSEHHSK